MIFETERLLVRYLQKEDISGFYKLESNPEVLRYATGEVDSFENIKISLKELIKKYENPENDFWIYAIERKRDKQFIGTIALIKDDENDDEVGIRFIQEYWGKGYGLEVGKGVITYCKEKQFSKLIAYVVDVNVASAKIITKLGFEPVKKLVSDDIGLPETKYELIL